MGESTSFVGLSQSIPTGYVPPGNPRGLAQKNLPGGRDLTFESCPGTGNTTRAEILWKMKLKLHKKGEKKIEFLTINGIFPGLSVNFLVLLTHIPYLIKDLRSCPWLVY